MTAGLYHTLNIGEQALYTTRQGVDTASHNIANAQVEGFSRQRIGVHARDPIFSRGVLIGSGSYIKDITRSHNGYIEKQINRAHQASGSAQGRFDALKGLEPIYSPELSAQVSDEVTNFFNSLQDLASTPEDIAIRTSVRENAKNLTGSFRRVDGDLRRQRKDLDDIVLQESAQISDLLKNIAQLNISVMEQEVTPGSVANDLRDERDLNLQKLTQKFQVNYYEDEFGTICVRGPDDIIMVERGFAAQVHTKSNDKNEGFMDVIITDWNGHHERNVTRKIEGGSLQGVIEVRDNIATRLIDDNNMMAATLAESVNEIHRKGFGIKDYNETTGRDFFRPIEDLRYAAREMDISQELYESIEAISLASTPMAIGDNVIGNQLIQIKDEKLFDNGKTNFVEFYSNYVGDLGIEINRAAHTKEAQDIVVADLQKQREAVSGVSLDEEAISLMKWQSNFTASSKVITTVDEMLETVLALKR